MTSRGPIRVALLWLVLSVAAAVWVAIDRRPPEWDHANHLERAVDCYRSLRIVTDSGAREILEASSFYPPLVTCAAGLLYFTFPMTPLTAQAVMMGFLALALAAVYGLGRRLADEETGWWAAFLFGTAPFVLFSLTNFQLDLPLAAMVAVTLYLLLRADDFSHAGWCAALGVALGLGMLTKPTFGIYILPPLLLSVWRGLGSGRRGPRMMGLGLAMAVGDLLALPWYGPRLAGLPTQIVNRGFRQAAEQQNPEPLTTAALLGYPPSALRALLPLARDPGSFRRLPSHPEQEPPLHATHPPGRGPGGRARAPGAAHAVAAGFNQAGPRPGPLSGDHVHLRRALPATPARTPD